MRAATTASTATAAHTQNPIVNPVSVGMPRGPLFADSTAAITAVPMLLPIVRAIVLTPIALPGLGGGDAFHDGVGCGREREPDSCAGEDPGDDDLPHLVVGDRGEQERGRDEEAAEEQRRFRAEPVHHHARDGSEDDHHHDRGQQEQSRFGDGHPEPESGLGRQLQQGRHEHEGAEHHEPEDQRDHVRGPYAADFQQAHVDEGFFHPQLHEHEREQRDRAEGQERDGGHRCPPPGVAFADRQEQRDQRHGEDAGAEDVEATGGLHR
jgi:hypothetical protein